MTGICSIPFASAGMAAANQIVDFEFQYAGAATGANGVKLALLSGQRSATGLAFLAIGGTDATAAVMSAAEATLLATPEAFQSACIPQFPTNGSEVTALITGLVNHFAQIEALADTGDAIGFCLKIPCRQVLSVELCIKDNSTMTNVIIAKAGPAVVIPEPVTLGGASKIIKTGTTEIDFDTDAICVASKNQLVFGSLKVVTAATVSALATADIVTLKIKAMV